MPRLIRSRYEPLEVIGHGGQGEILRAIDRQHDRQVALKVRKVASPEEREALLSEARILLGLQPHRSLPLVRDDFFVRDRYYLVMDWVEGETLQRILELRGDPGLPVSLVLGYIADAAAALDHLHAHRPPIVHGDVKPANLIVTSDGRVVLVDFGISRVAGTQEKAMGTAGFTAPEVVARAGYGPPVDVYGLGATTFALLTGAPPSGVQPAWEGLARASAAAAERAIRQALSSDPSRRPSSASQLVERLRSWQDTALPTGIVTFLLSDIEGSTGLWEQQPELMEGVLARHNELIAETVERHGGRLMQDRGEGDSTFSVFERASDSVKCALDLQLRIAAEPWPADVSLRVRIGVHSGEAEVRGGAYTGNTTNLAARVRSLARGGQILLSQTTAGLVRGLFPSVCTLVDLGEHRLKGLAQAEQVFELRHPDLPDEVRPKPPAGDGGRETRIPRLATTFVGRRGELDETSRLLSDARLLTLTGPGGTGKTRLAIELASEVEDHYPAGVFFVDLSSLAEAGGVSRTVAVTLGVLDPLVETDPEKVRSGSAIEDRLLEFLAPMRALLLIDNCEHLQDECARFCAALLTACPSLSILTTSRGALRIAGERVYQVPGLSGPREGADSDSLERSDAVRLFIERARGVRSGYRLAAEDVGRVAEICRRLDGLPLAIELVVARLPVLTVSEILPRLDDALRGVSGSGRATPERHRSIEATIRWSHELLDEQERALFRRLGVFVGGATLEAIERVCGQQPVDSASVLDTLQSLVEKSLVAVEQDDGSRFRFLETMRRFALDRLAESGESEDVRRRHRDYFQSLVPPMLPGSSFDESLLPIVARERDNTRAALRWSLEAGEAHVALWLSMGQSWYWRYAGLSAEIQDWIDEALARGTDESPQLAVVLLVLGGQASYRTDYARALGLWEECLPVFRQDGNFSAAGWALMGSGYVWGLWGNRERSEPLLREAVDSFEAAGDTFGAQWSRFTWALQALSRGEDALAGSLCEDILARAGDDLANQPVRSARVISGVLEAFRGNLERARDMWREGLSADSANEHGWLLLYVSGSELRIGDPKRARDALLESLQLSKRTGLAESIPWALELAAIFAVRNGAMELAARLLGVVRRLERESGLALECVVWAAPLVEARRGVEAVLGVDRAERERSAGERMAVSKAVDLALEVLERVPERSEPEKEGKHGATLSPLQPLFARQDQAIFVGRTSDRARLQERWSRAQSGERQFLLVSGEPGIGKTRLAVEFARTAHAEGATVLYGRSDEESLVPYQPFVEVLRHLVATLPPERMRALLGPGGGELLRIVPEMAQRIANLPEPVQGDPDGERYRLFDAMASLFKAVAAEASLFILLDDLHWADKPTLLLLKYILRSTEDLSLLILGTARETGLAPAHSFAESLADIRREHEYEWVPLGGLDEPALIPMIEAWAGRVPPPEFARAVHSETEGNPFFVGEVLRHLRDVGLITAAGNEWPGDLTVEKLGIPEGVRQAVARRLSRLSETCNRVLSVASVVGRQFGLDVLGRVTGLPVDQLLEAVEPAAAAKVIEEDRTTPDRYTFVHTLIRDTLYEQLSTSRRLRLHAQIGEALESVHARDPEPHLAELAHHFVEAASLGEVDRAVEYATRAGHRALSLLAYEEAATAYGRALNVLERTEPIDERRRSELLLALGEAETKAGETPIAKETLLRAAASARLCAAGEVIARAALAYAGNTEWSTAIVEGAEHPQIALLQEAMDVLPNEGDPLRVMVLARLALALYWTSSPSLRDRAERICREALESAKRLGHPAALAAALEARYYALWQEENVEDRISDGREALRLARDAGDREQEMRLRRLLIFDTLQLGDVSAIEQEMEAHARLAQEARQPRYAAYTAMFAATKAFMEGRLAEGARYARESFEIGQGEGLWAISGGFFGAQMMVTWRVDGSLADWAPALREAADAIPIPATRAAMALFLCDLGQLDDARVVYEGLAEGDFSWIPRDPAWLQTLAFLSEVCVALGDTTRARRLYELLLPYLKRNLVGGPPALAYLGPVARHLGALAATIGRTREATEHFEAALRMTTAMGARPFHVLTQYDYASALLSAGQRDRGVALLDEALGTAEELGMKAIVQRIQGLRNQPTHVASFRAGDTPFIGRVEEREHIARVFAEVRDGRGKLLVVSGEPGVGKTRLAFEFANGAHGEGATVLYGRCDEETLLPYQPFVEALKQLVDISSPADLADMFGAGGGEISRLVPDIRRRVSGLSEPIQGDPEGERYRLFEAVAGVLRATAARQPTVLLLDDLHWADKPTLLLIRHLLRASTASLLIIGIYRESEVSREHPLAGILVDLRQEQGFERIALEGLAETEVAEMVEAVAGRTAQPSLARALHDETDGNPFFLTEVVRHLKESGLFEGSEAGPSEALLTGAGIPEGVRDVIARRLSRLSDAAKNLLSFGAVVGRAFALDVVARAADIDEDELLGAVEQAISAKVIEEDPAKPEGYTFTHALIRETLYEELGASRRLRFHHRVGVAIEESHARDLGRHLAALSLHFLRGHSADAQKAIEYSIGAGERAASQLAYEEAANYYQRALDALGSAGIDDESLRSRLLLLLGESQRKSGDPAAKPTLKEALDSARRAGAGETFARAALLYAGPMSISSAVLRDDQSLEISVLEEAAENLSGQSESLLVRVLARRAVALYWALRRDEAAALSERALDLARPAGDPASLAVALSAHRYATWVPGNVQSRLEGAREILRLARKAGDREQELEADSWLLMDLLELGDARGAMEALDAYVALASDLKQPRYLGYASMFQAVREIMEGRFERGKELADEALSISQQMHNIDAVNLYSAQMFGVWRSTGVLKGFEQMLRDVIKISPVPAAHAGLTLILVDVGKLDDARRELDVIAAHDFTDLPRDLIFLQTMGFLAEVAWALDDRRRAELLYEILRPYAAYNSVSGPPPLAVWAPVPHFLGMLLATIGRPDEAEEQFKAALDMCDALNAAPLKANTQYVYAHMLANRDRTEPALKLIDVALSTADRIGMSLLVEQLQTLKGRLDASARTGPSS